MDCPISKLWLVIVLNENENIHAYVWFFLSVLPMKIHKFINHKHTSTWILIKQLLDFYQHLFWKMQDLTQKFPRKLLNCAVAKLRDKPNDNNKSILSLMRWQ